MPRQSKRKTSGPTSKASSSKVVKSPANKPAPKDPGPSKAPSRRSTRSSTQASSSKKGKRAARSKSLTSDNEPMDIDVESNSRWPMDRDQYANFVDYSVLSAYAGGMTIEKIPRGKRQPRWTHEGEDPLTNPAELPKGWNTREPDLLDDEIDEQIERCHERIADNIYPEVFKIRLNVYLERKKRRDDMIASEPAGLDWQTVQRLDSLKAIEKSIIESDVGDEHGQLPNIRALMKAYSIQDMMFIRGMMSYWTNGVQVGSPQPWDHKRHETLLAAHETHRGFWVEGFFGPGPVRQMSFTLFPPKNQNFTHEIWTDMRTIGSTVNCAPVGLPFVYDTGAEIMSINQADVDQMKQISAIEPTDLGSIQLMTCNGVVSRRVVEIEVSIRDHNWVFMCPFFKILATVNPDNSADRLTGPWMRYVLFSATTPDAPNLYLADNKRELIQYLPPWNTPSTGP